MRWSTFGMVAAAGALACGGGRGEEQAGPHPAAFVGRWERFREDGTWGDTMEFRADGSVGGSAGYAVPAALRWEVTRDSAQPPQFCAKLGQDGGFCRPYRLAGDEMELVGGPNGNTRFRRAR